MIERAVFLCVAAAAVLSAAAAGKCPKRCQCLTMIGDFREAVSCAHQNRSDIPVEFPPDTEYIKYEGNRLMELTRDFTFPALHKLRRLDLQTGKLRKIGADAFSNFPALEVLHLNENVIEVIEAGAFRGMSALQLLDLRENKLSELPDAVFSTLTLDSLWLTNNRLTTITNDTFKGASVVTLKMSGNAIGKLPAKALYPLRSNLTKLIWNDNEQPLKIARTAFSGCHLLELSLVNSLLDSDTSFLEHVYTKQLDLSSNQLSPILLNLTKYTSLKTVLHLRMRNMSLTSISSHLLPNSRWLQTLDLTRNKLTTAPGNTFKWVTGLKTILLSKNLLTRLPELLGDVLPGLRELRVSGNKISTVDAKTLAPFAARRLHLLDISSNRIQTLHESLRPLLDKIDTFMASGNPLHCNCELLWYREWLNGPGISEHGLYDRCMTPAQQYIVYLLPSSFTCTVPRIAHVTPNKQVNEGDDISLMCSAVADPAPKVEWTAPSGEAISITPSQDRNRNKTMAVWRVAAIRRQQAGNYTCTASNLRGNVTVSVCVGVRTPGSTRTVCDGRPAMGLTTTEASRAETTATTTTVSRAETTAEAASSLTVRTTRDDVISSSSTSVAPTSAETTALQPRETTVQQHLTVAQLPVNATLVVNSKDQTTTTYENTTIDISILLGPSADKQSSSGGWIIAVAVAVVVAAILIFVLVVVVVCVRRRRSSRSTYFTDGSVDKSIADKKLKKPDTEIALIPPRAQPNQILGDELKTAGNDKPEHDAMLSHNETCIVVGNSGQEGATAKMVKRQDEGNSGKSQSNRAFVLRPSSYSSKTNVDETRQDTKGQSSENNSEQNNAEKRNDTGPTLHRSFSTNPEGGTSLSTGRLSRGETEA